MVETLPNMSQVVEKFEVQPPEVLSDPFACSPPNIPVIKNEGLLNIQYVSGQDHLGEEKPQIWNKVQVGLLGGQKKLELPAAYKSAGLTPPDWSLTLFIKAEGSAEEQSAKIKELFTKGDNELVAMAKEFVTMDANPVGEYVHIVITSEHPMFQQGKQMAEQMQGMIADLMDLEATIEFNNFCSKGITEYLQKGSFPLMELFTGLCLKFNVKLPEDWQLTAFNKAKSLNPDLEQVPELVVKAAQLLQSFGVEVYHNSSQDVPFIFQDFIKQEMLQYLKGGQEESIMEDAPQNIKDFVNMIFGMFKADVHIIVSTPYAGVTLWSSIPDLQKELFQGYFIKLAGDILPELIDNLVRIKRRRTYEEEEQPLLYKPIDQMA